MKHCHSRRDPASCQSNVLLQAVCSSARISGCMTGQPCSPSTGPLYAISSLPTKTEKSQKKTISDSHQMLQPSIIYNCGLLVGHHATTILLRIDDSSLRASGAPQATSFLQANSDEATHPQAIWWAELNIQSHYGGGAADVCWTVVCRHWPLHLFGLGQHWRCVMRLSTQLPVISIMSHHHNDDPVMAGGQGQSSNVTPTMHPKAPLTLSWHSGFIHNNHNAACRRSTSTHQYPHLTSHNNNIMSVPTSRSTPSSY